MAAVIGTGTVVTFPDPTAYTMDVLSVGWSDATRGTVDSTHLGTTTARTHLETTLYDGGTVELELHLDPTATVVPGVFDNTHGTLKVAFPGGGSWSAAAVATGFSFGVPLEDKMTATATFKISGAITIA